MIGKTAVCGTLKEIAVKPRIGDQVSLNLLHFISRLFMEVCTFQLSEKVSETDPDFEIFGYVVQHYCTNRLV